MPPKDSPPEPPPSQPAEPTRVGSSTPTKVAPTNESGTGGNTTGSSSSRKKKNNARPKTPNSNSYAILASDAIDIDSPGHSVPAITGTVSVNAAATGPLKQQQQNNSVGGGMTTSKTASRKKSQQLVVSGDGASHRAHPTSGTLLSGTAASDHEAETSGVPEDTPSSRHRRQRNRKRSNAQASVGINSPQAKVDRNDEVEEVEFDSLAAHSELRERRSSSSASSAAAAANSTPHASPEDDSLSSADHRNSTNGSGRWEPHPPSKTAKDAWNRFEGKNQPGAGRGRRSSRGASDSLAFGKPPQALVNPHQSSSSGDANVASGSPPQLSQKQNFIAMLSQGSPELVRPSPLQSPGEGDRDRGTGSGGRGGRGGHRNSFGEASSGWGGQQPTDYHPKAGRGDSRKSWGGPHQRPEQRGQGWQASSNRGENSAPSKWGSPRTDENGWQWGTRPSPQEGSQWNGSPQGRDNHSHRSKEKSDRSDSEFLSGGSNRRRNPNGKGDLKMETQVPHSSPIPIPTSPRENRDRAASFSSSPSPRAGPSSYNGKQRPETPQTPNRRQFDGHRGTPQSERRLFVPGGSPNTNSPRARPSRPLYEEYLTLDQVEKGLLNKSLFKGVIRINKRVFYDAYVTAEGMDDDIYIPGKIRRNRALEGDTVVVQILTGEELGNEQERDLDRVNQKRKENEQRQSQVAFEDAEVVPDVDNFEDDKTSARVFGKVVYILDSPEERMFIGSMSVDVPTAKTPSKFALGTPVDSSVNVVWFRPNDKRVPFLMVPVENAPSEFLRAPASFEGTLWKASIKKWPIHRQNPYGIVHGKIGLAGSIPIETEAILVENGIHWSDFPEPVLECLPSMPWTVPESECLKRRDFRDTRVFSIDPLTARDLDDALSITPQEDGTVEVGVHIADVSYFVQAGTALDEEARNRATTVYLTQKAVPMLPRLLCEELCSLNPGVERLAFSVVWKMNAETAEILDKPWMGRSVIRSCAKLSYEHAQRHIDGGDWSDMPKVSITGGFTEDEIRSDTMKLLHLSKKLRAKRFESGALTMNTAKLWFALDDDGNPTGCGIYEIKDSNKLIEEFMLLANMSVAQRIVESFPDTSLLRRHDPPKAKPLQTFLDFVESCGIPFDAETSLTLQKSFDAIKDEDIANALRQLCVKPMQRARYYCTGSTAMTMWSHYALCVPLYTHFTSPIRRYCDLVVHRLLGAALDGVGSGDALPPSPYEVDEVSLIAARCNEQKFKAKDAQDASQRLYLCVYLSSIAPTYDEESGTGGVLVSSALVYKVGDRCFDVVVGQFGIEKRVWIEDLVLTGEIWGCEPDVKSGALKVFWKKAAGAKTSAVDVAPERNASAADSVVPEREDDDDDAAVFAMDPVDGEAGRDASVVPEPHAAVPAADLITAASGSSAALASEISKTDASMGDDEDGTTDDEGWVTESDDGDELVAAVPVAVTKVQDPSPLIEAKTASKPLTTPSGKLLTSAQGGNDAEVPSVKGGATASDQADSASSSRRRRRRKGKKEANVVDSDSAVASASGAIKQPDAGGIKNATAAVVETNGGKVTVAPRPRRRADLDMSQVLVQTIGVFDKVPVRIVVNLKRSPPELRLLPVHPNLLETQPSLFVDYDSTGQVGAGRSRAKYNVFQEISCPGIVDEAD
ncbi:hypothetical protein DFJ73DRAFT_842129 [Zopfochytrium polystomum]|nr:hypothetical protein DFJ73DRAFT_842129 [Zopfochytrium polystomum]